MLEKIKMRLKSRLEKTIQKQNISLLQNLPKVIFFNVTTRCNMHCVMCDVGKGNKESQFYKNLAGEGKHFDFDIDNALKFLNDVIKYKPLVVICATEPLLYKDIHKFIKILSKKGLYVDMLTNGYLLKEHAQHLVNNGLSSIHISIDGIGELHDKIRGMTGCFSKIGRAHV